MREILLIRHGETFANLGNSTNESLTPNGLSQIKVLSEYLKDYSATFIFSSKLERAQLTAGEILLNQPGAEYVELDCLNEINQTIIGLPPNDKTSSKGNLDSLLKMKELWGLINDSDFDRAIMVTHGNTIRGLLTKVLGISYEKGNFFETHQTSITRIVHEKKWRIIDCNNYSHLPPELYSVR